MGDLNIHQKLNAIQSMIKANKGQRNTFGNYNYRSCEDILEALKRFITNYGVNVTLSDELVCVGSRYYVKATATITDFDGNSISTTAYAREEETLKGMTSSQITGSTSSYARKYALSGLLALDDNKDADALTDLTRFPEVNATYTCEKCGKAIEDSTDANGKKISAKRFAEGTKQKFGKYLCADCV